MPIKKFFENFKDDRTYYGYTQEEWKNKSDREKKKLAQERSAQIYKEQFSKRIKERRRKGDPNTIKDGEYTLRSIISTPIGQGHLRGFLSKQISEGIGGISKIFNGVKEERPHIVVKSEEEQALDMVNESYEKSIKEQEAKAAATEQQTIPEINQSTIPSNLPVDDPNNFAQFLTNQPTSKQDKVSQEAPKVSPVKEGVDYEVIRNEDLNQFVTKREATPVKKTEKDKYTAEEIVRRNEARQRNLERQKTFTNSARDLEKTVNELKPSIDNIPALKGSIDKLREKVDGLIKRMDQLETTNNREGAKDDEIAALSKEISKYSFALDTMIRTYNQKKSQEAEVFGSIQDSFNSYQKREYNYPGTMDKFAEQEQFIPTLQKMGYEMMYHEPSGRYLAVNQDQTFDDYDFNPERDVQIEEIVNKKLDNFSLRNIETKEGEAKFKNLFKALEGDVAILQDIIDGDLTDKFSSSERTSLLNRIAKIGKQIMEFDFKTDEILLSGTPEQKSQRTAEVVTTKNNTARMLKALSGKGIEIENTSIIKPENGVYIVRYDVDTKSGDLTKYIENKNIADEEVNDEEENIDISAIRNQLFENSHVYSEKKRELYSQIKDYINKGNNFYDLQKNINSLFINLAKEASKKNLDKIDVKEDFIYNNNFIVKKEDFGALYSTINELEREILDPNTISEYDLDNIKLPSPEQVKKALDQSNQFEDQQSPNDVEYMQYMINNYVKPFQASEGLTAYLVLNENKGYVPVDQEDFNSRNQLKLELPMSRIQNKDAAQAIANVLNKINTTINRDGYTYSVQGSEGNYIVFKTTNKNENLPPFTPKQKEEAIYANNQPIQTEQKPVNDTSTIEPEGEQFSFVDLSEETKASLKNSLDDEGSDAFTFVDLDNNPANIEPQPQESEPEQFSFVDLENNKVDIPQVAPYGSEPFGFVQNINQKTNQEEIITEDRFQFTKPKPTIIETAPEQTDFQVENIESTPSPESIDNGLPSGELMEIAVGESQLAGAPINPEEASEIQDSIDAYVKPYIIPNSAVEHWVLDPQFGFEKVTDREYEFNTNGIKLEIPRTNIANIDAATIAENYLNALPLKGVQPGTSFYLYESAPGMYSIDVKQVPPSQQYEIVEDEEGFELNTEDPLDIDPFSAPANYYDEDELDDPNNPFTGNFQKPDDNIISQTDAGNPFIQL